MKLLELRLSALLMNVRLISFWDSGIRVFCKFSTAAVSSCLEWKKSNVRRDNLKQLVCHKTKQRHFHQIFNEEHLIVKNDGNKNN